MNIEDILNEVNKVGLCILPSMDSKLMYKLRGDIHAYKKYTTFVVKDLKNNELKVCVRKYERNFNLNFSELSKEALMYYRKGEYEKSLELNLKILSISKSKPHPIILGSIGMCYLKLGDLDSAITYLEVATLISFNKNGKIDYSELINKLKGKKKKEIKEMKEDEDKKVFVRFNEEDFKKEDFSVKYIDNIFNLINEGASVKDACMRLGLDYQEYLKVLLVIAREYYYIGLLESGDRLLNIVKRDKNKSEITLRLIKEVESNRKFYQYRENQVKRMTLKHNYLV